MKRIESVPPPDDFATLAVMSETHRRVLLVGIFALAACMFFTGIQWGLPSRDADKFLYGAHEPWTGRQIIDLAGGWDESADRGADVAMHLLSGRNQPIVLNETDEQAQRLSSVIGCIQRSRMR